MSKLNPSELPEGKRTTLGLYVTAADAYKMWMSAPEKVKVIDVRTPEEWALMAGGRFNVRFEAIISIARNQSDPRLVEALINTLNGTELAQSALAAWALGRIGGEHAVAGLDSGDVDVGAGVDLAPSFASQDVPDLFGSFSTPLLEHRPVRFVAGC